MRATTLIFALACAVFGWWGMFTNSGSRRFEEMDGMIPFYALVGACVIILILLIAESVKYLRK